MGAGGAGGMDPFDRYLHEDKPQTHTLSSMSLSLPTTLLAPSICLLRADGDTEGEGTCLEFSKYGVGTLTPQSSLSGQVNPGGNCCSGFRINTYTGRGFTAVKEAPVDFQS